MFFKICSYEKKTTGEIETVSKCQINFRAIQNECGKYVKFISEKRELYSRGMSQFLY